MKIKEVIIVEGKNDAAHLKNFLDVDIITTNGSEISKETLNTIKEINKTRGIIIFSDPDYPGEKIRKTIQEQIKNAKNAFILKEKALGKNKVGIEHAKKEDILKSLENVVTFQKEGESDITTKDMYDFNLLGNKNSKIVRKKICNHYNIGISNAKIMLKRLKMSNINKKDLWEVIENV